ncbi:borealin isoform X2 [Pararge aegeria]|uniref:Jg9585 protein n=2 Tax=Pararge aegeria TaxID=116150 RepID=A0A8S4S3V7_9NEOP|nr:borealin isoform X2 [Pararge aegeria]CAH2250473.1 jg9585 [Pararge aegeria aegeria]
MPRTKRPARKQDQGSENDALSKIDKLATEWKNKFDSKALMQIKNIELSFKILLESISVEDLNKTVGQLKAEATRQPSRAVSHDDGYLSAPSVDGSGGKSTKSKLVPPSASRGRRSRSADASARSIKTVSRPTAQKRRSRSVYKTPAYQAPAYPTSVYKTPAYNKNSSVQYPAITPKVAPNTPLAVLRQPRQGEMVFSMSGSPLMASSYNTMKPHEKANCNIVLQDGTTLSLQPQQLRTSQHSIPFSLMDNTVLNQLKTLKDNLEKVCKLGEKVID